MPGQSKRFGRTTGRRQASPAGTSNSEKTKGKRLRQTTLAKRSSERMLPGWSRAVLRVAKDCIRHWTAAGMILVLSGFAPEYWVARLVHAIWDAWIAIDGRVTVVLVGMTIIVCDTLLRRHVG
jgi:hypothetical protein